VLLRLIGKWLNAGVQHAGDFSRPDAGTPQGGVISPLLANIYLHEVLDEWVEKEVKPRLEGRCFLVRYADDFVMGFSSEGDARRVLDVLPKRFGKYGLTLHPGKTRLLQFTRPTGSSGGNTPGSFDFLGFNHHWVKSLKGRWLIQQTTAKSRFTRSLKKVAAWCRGFRHQTLRLQHRHLSAVLRGHFQYFGLRGNSRALSRFAYEVNKVWRKWLARRSQRGLSWEGFNAILKRFVLPPPRIPPARLRAANP
jgi:RNA-directed DNA polymerase